jgi:hypothetical protein
MLTIKFIEKVFFLLTTIFLFVLQYFSGWFYLGGRNGFGDFGYVLERIPCIEGNWDVLYGPRTDDVCSGYIYGSSLLNLLKAFNASSSNLFFLSYFFISVLTIIFLCSIFSLKLNFLQKLFSTILFFSPPIVLLIERLNIDLLIFIVVFFAANTPKRIANCLTPLLIGITSAVKFYTLPIFLPLLKQAHGKIKVYTIAILSFVVYIILMDLNRIQNLPWDARNMFGNVIWAEYLLYLVNGSQTHGNFFLASIFGLTIFCSVYLALMNLPIAISLKGTLTEKNQRFILYLSLIYISCYFIGLNVDYRMIYLLFIFMIFESIFLFNELGSALFRIGVFLSFFMSYPTGWLQPIGDLAQIVVICLVIRGLSLLFRGTTSHIFNEGFKVCRVVFSRITRYR